MPDGGGQGPAGSTIADAVTEIVNSGTMVVVSAVEMLMIPINFIALTISWIKPVSDAISGAMG